MDEKGRSVKKNERRKRGEWLWGEVGLGKREGNCGEEWGGKEIGREG